MTKTMGQHSISSVFLGLGILGIILSIIMLFIKGKQRTRPIILGSTVLIWMIYFAQLFFIADDGKFIPYKINVEYWAHFGTFIGAFLLAITLLIQVRMFRKQQIEAKFFEMVKYYRDNVNEMQFRNPFYYEHKTANGTKENKEEITKARQAIATIFQQYRVAQKLAKYYVDKHVRVLKKNKDGGKILEDIKDNYFNDLIKNHKAYRASDENWQSNFIINDIAYMLVLWGLPGDVDTELQDFMQGICKQNNASTFIKDAKKIIRLDECDECGKCATTKTKAELSQALWKSLPAIIEEQQKQTQGILRRNCKDMQCENSNGKTRFFGGHQYQLAHFFRHLHQLVYYIDKQPMWLVNKDEKQDYINILRAQMSTYELAMLFIHSLSNQGRDWEYEPKRNGLISKYNILQNLPKNFIPLMNPEHYYPKKA